MAFEIIAKTKKGKEALEKIKDSKAKGGRLVKVKDEPYTLQVVYPKIVEKLVRGNEEHLLPSLENYVYSELNKYGTSKEDIKVVIR